MILALTGLCIVYNFLNGFNDSSTIVATIIASRAIPPRLALLLVALAELCGPFLFGVAVAQTIGRDLVSIQAIDLGMLVAAMLAAVLWGLFTWLLGMPSSSSHALVGGLMGGTAASLGLGAIHWEGMLKVILSLFLSPVAGFLVGFLFLKVLLWMCRKATLKINRFFRGVQLLTALGLGASHGTNDASKAMGVLTLGLVSSGGLVGFTVPTWVVLILVLSMALGTSIGGWRQIRTVGMRIMKIHPIHGFATQLGATLVILTAALVGGPVSTTQVIGSTLIGVGTAQAAGRVNWNMARQIQITWLVTIPATALLAAFFVWMLRYLLY